MYKSFWTTIDLIVAPEIISFVGRLQNPLFYHVEVEITRQIGWANGGKRRTTLPEEVSCSELAD